MGEEGEAEVGERERKRETQDLVTSDSHRTRLMGLLSHRTVAPGATEPLKCVTKKVNSKLHFILVKLK